MGKALIVVDVQNDFAEGGALGVGGGRSVAHAINHYLTNHREQYQLVVASRDWHDPDSDNGGHFAAEPDFVDTWPPHCVRGTVGAEYVDALDTSLVGVHLVKGMGTPSYSAFEAVREDDHTATLDAVLAEHGVTEVEVVGLATDYCVRATALDAVSAGYRTTLLSDLSAAVHPQNWASLRTELTAAGVTVISEPVT